MTQRISNLQLILLVANFIFSAFVISLPQIIVHVSGQNSWLVPIILFPVFWLVVYVLIGKRRNIDHVKDLFAIGKKSRGMEKVFILVFFLFVSIAFLADLRALLDFIASVLLPSTPLDILMILTIFIIIYISMAGLEVISRINSIHFFILVITVLSLPLLLLNEWQPGNLKPLPSISNIMDIIKSAYFISSWLGEMILFLIIIASVNPLKQARKAVISGTALGFLLVFIVLFMEIIVLGTNIVMETTYPTYILIQQINITDFLDRLDLVLVSVWIPCMVTKLAYMLYAINYCLGFFYKSNTNKFLFPIAFIFGYLSLLLFKNSMEHTHFSFYSWASLGLGLEVLLILLFLFVRRSASKHHEKSLNSM
ncbi:spore germination protein [Neobacillus niacini]|uniref:GerAB/ArcD/ProY family transporter n=1 Tax=Neobacillus niacini TaxID=86668 RepID=UPI0021CB048B|nr:spore germination protein [Neobacillus niacini]MCM3765515.1 spore germination protein [Neobacillus niacini]